MNETEPLGKEQHCDKIPDVESIIEKTQKNKCHQRKKVECETNLHGDDSSHLKIQPNCMYSFTSG